MTTSLGADGEGSADRLRPLPAAIQQAVLAKAALGDVPQEPRSRPAAKAIRVLLPVWGEDFVAQFLEYSLPTLLAPGNIPALAKALPTHFVFLTRARDEAAIRAHPACERLSEFSAVEFLPIDDLVTSGNHSTTITLAYARAVRSTGAAMLETGFFFLVSDYIMADGSLESVWARIEGGASAVQVGNFQLEEEIAEPWLRKLFSGAGAPVALTPRELMRRALGCLHPVTAANFVNFPLCHNFHTNRLLWRVDNDTLIGRFYLLHMICIRPERTDFVVGSSCDYSFVPEMCPSGNVVTITDSDDYLVVELQPGAHERHFLRLGPNSVETLAESLSEWTTAGHRANAQQTIVFHAKALPAGLFEVLAEADALIRKISVKLASPPQPHRDHPYWLGAIAAFEAVTQRELHEPLLVRALRWVRRNVFGRVPEVTRAHPRWKDFRLPLGACKALVADASPRVIIGANHSTAFTEWLRSQVPGTVQGSLRRILRHRPVAGAEPGGFDACVIELVDNDISRVDESLRLMMPLLRSGGQIIVAAINVDWTDNTESFGRDLASIAASLVHTGLWPDEVRVASASRLRWWVNGACILAADALFRRPTLLLPFQLLVAAALLPVAVAANLISSWRADRPPDKRVVSSFFIRFRVDSTPAANDTAVERPLEFADPLETVSPYPASGL